MTAGGGCDLAMVSAFRLGGLEVRPPTREVIGAAGPIVLEPRVMQVLVTLAGRRGEVVSRGQLIDDCWAGRAVGDDAINRCIQAIRKLADSHGGFSILTVARVGYRLDESDQAPAAPPPAAAPATALPAASHIPEASERRHLNILSCTLGRSAAAGLDPESWYAIAAEWRALAIAAAERFGAHVESAHGDRLIAAFGYPEAQEDAAERAVRAGLALVEQTALLNARLGEAHGIALSVAAGIHAGVALVARRGDGGVELFGEALDLAMRVEARAEPNAVLVTGPVLDMVAGQLVVEPVGALDDGPALHRVRSAGLAGERRQRGDEAEFVGREEELALLAGRWARVRQESGQLVLVHGEPGIGKSRLVAAFRERIAAEPHLWIECRGEQLFANTALHASAQMLWRGLGWRGDESPEERAAALERALERSALKVAEALPLIAELLGLPVPGHVPPLLLAPEQRRRRLLSALADWLFAATRGQPVVLVIEDLHWLDPSSLELLHRLAEQGSGVPLLLLCTARPEFRAAWPARAHHIQIALGGLAPAEIRALVTGLDVAEAGAAVDAIVDRADGIPLFAEALARLVGDQAAEAEIPATLMDSLSARLDRLGDAREVARTAAVIGRSFSWTLLRAVSDEPDEALQAGLERLVEAGLVVVRGAPPDASYRFRHALIRDAAYDLLLAAQRRDRHRSVAEAIAGKVAAAEPEELAHHWTEAGEAERAIAAWAAAAALAYGRHAFAEAASAYRRALAVLATLPDTPARDARELDLSAALSLALVPTQGVQAPEVAAIAERRHALARRGGNLGALVTASTYAFLAAHFHSEWDQAAQLADQVADLARHAAPDIRPETLAYGRAMGHFCHAVAFFYRGELAEADLHFHAWEELNRERRYEERGAIVMAFATAALQAWHMGDSAEVERRIACAWEHACSADNPFDNCCCLALEALVNVHRRDVAAVEALAGQALALARERNFAQFEAWAGACLGWARAHAGAPAEGVALIREGLSLLARIQSRLSLPWFLSMLGEAQGLAGDAAAAFDSFEQALTICPQERIHRPIALIARGELAASLGDTALAEASLREAIATAELMRAAAPKQRAAEALARLRGGTA